MRPAARLATAAACLALAIAGQPALRAERPLPDQDILDYLSQTIAWYRDVAAATQSPAGPADAVYADDVRRTATEALRLAFDFARAQAALASADVFVGPEPPDARGRNLVRAAAAARQQAEQIQSDIDQVNRRLQAGDQRLLPLLRAQRDELTSELNFAKARRDALQNLVGFFSQPGEGGLSAKISDLERSVPEAARPQKGAQPTGPAASAAPPAPAGAAAATAAGANFNPQTAGVIGLTSQIFSVSRAAHRLAMLMRQTDDLRQANQKLRAPLRKLMQEVTSEAETASRMADSEQTESLRIQKLRIDDLLERFKSLVASSTPLSEQAAQIGAARARMAEWRATLDNDYRSALHYLLLRLGLLLAAIAVVFAVAEIWRRTTLRYVKDMRRRRQILLLRRVVVGCIVGLLVLLSFVTEFGSLATFAGFSAAGLAVAMQSVILSVVAYFFLVGRWGVRVGDRITVGGVTGEVVDIGLFRLYLMELGGAGLVHPTGRIVVFPNAVFFQPSALFKQLPGIEYGWRRITMTLAESADYPAVEDRLRSAVEKVCADYQHAVERQHKAALSSMNVHAPAPRPESRVRLVDDGLQVTIRYPAEFSRADEVDDRVTRAVVEELAREPKLRLATGGAPKVETTAG